jgi:D-alanyl-lipoteichoic acid acyltransferase DltB (MBOAT superfamily)
MAIGIALLLGFHFPINFDSPYQSHNITEFWRRWHISLSTWLRDYLYISLGGNRKGKVRTYINQMVTMVLGGLWHGASWRFIVWGALHGAALCFHKMFRSWRIQDDYKPGWWAGALNIFITFHFVCFCWIFFRAAPMDTAGQMIGQIMNHPNPQILFEFISGYKNVVLLMAIGYLLHFMPQRATFALQKGVTEMPLALKAVWVAAIIVLVIQTKSAAIQPFIYFQF